jgi:hypothetical protein
MKLQFLDTFAKNTQIPNIMEICPVGAELFHVEGRTDGQTRRSLYSLFEDFSNAPKREIFTTADMFKEQKWSVYLYNRLTQKTTLSCLRLKQDNVVFCVRRIIQIH